MGRGAAIDVREPAEYELARVEGARLLPLSRFKRVGTVARRAVETVVMCHHGIRSAQSALTSRSRVLKTSATLRADRPLVLRG